MSKELLRNTRPSSRELGSVIEIKTAQVTSPRLTVKRTITTHYLDSFSITYNAVAIDYDGTMIPVTDRDARPGKELISTVGDFLDAQIPVVIISGRGHSLLKLRVKPHVEDSLALLFLAMYNGSVVSRGDNKEVIHSAEPHFDKTYRSLTRDIRLQRFAEKIIQTEHFGSRFIVRNSGFAIDIYNAHRSKDRCLTLVTKLIGRSLRFLRIGDQGHELGNDYELLRSKGGFSVGTVSSDPRSCFPVLDSTGLRIPGPQGTLHLLTRIFNLN